MDMLFCRVSNGEYFEKNLIRWDEQGMRYRQNTKGDILYGPPVIAQLAMNMSYSLLKNAVDNVFVLCLSPCWHIYYNQLYDKHVQY